MMGTKRMLPDNKLPEWACKKELPCSCALEPVEHEQDYINKREYVWVCASCGHRKEWPH
jgi:hypothetical protein